MRQQVKWLGPHCPWRIFLNDLIPFPPSAFPQRHAVPYRHGGAAPRTTRGKKWKRTRKAKERTEGKSILTAGAAPSPLPLPPLASPPPERPGHKLAHLGFPLEGQHRWGGLTLVEEHSACGGPGGVPTHKISRRFFIAGPGLAFCEEVVAGSFPPSSTPPQQTRTLRQW